MGQYVGSMLVLLKFVGLFFFLAWSRVGFLGFLMDEVLFENLS